MNQHKRICRTPVSRRGFARRRRLTIRCHRGAVLAMALVCLLVVSLLGGLGLRAVLRGQQQALRREHQLQALWLAESAIGRARAALAAAPDYAGESWRLAAEELGGPDSALIEIVVQPGQTPTARRIAIQANFPDDSSRRVVHRQTLEIQLPNSGEQP